MAWHRHIRNLRLAIDCKGWQLWEDDDDAMVWWKRPGTNLHSDVNAADHRRDYRHSSDCFVGFMGTLGYRDPTDHEDIEWGSRKDLDSFRPWCPIGGRVV